MNLKTASFGVLTSIYTLGGLFGSLVAGRVADSRGRRAAVVWAAWAVALGTAFMSLGRSLGPLILGRYVDSPNYKLLEGDLTTSR
jgi:SP family facilitated glucose transporter-like MFS transporter 3